jgi:hypothetical protein
MPYDVSPLLPPIEPTTAMLEVGRKVVQVNGEPLPDVYLRAIWTGMLAASLQELADRVRLVEGFMRGAR